MVLKGGPCIFEPRLSRCSPSPARLAEKGMRSGPSGTIGRVMRTLPFTLLAFLALATPAQAAALPCAQDEGLAEAAALLLLEGRRIGETDITAALRSARSDLPSARALSVHPDDQGAVRGWLRRVGNRSKAPLVCGEASSGERRVVLAAAREGWLALEGDQVRARVADGFGEPHLVVRDADDRLWRHALDPGALEARAQLPEGLAHPLTIQLMATGPQGPRPVAVRTTGSGPSALPTSAGGATPTGDTFPVADRLTRLRDAHGASPLRDNRLLTEEAAAHAARVCETRRVAHELDPGADPEARLGRRNIHARVVGETVVRARTARTGFATLADSPGHLMTLTDRRFTDVGIGQARDRSGHTCLVILLAAWPRYQAR
jgi:uncharacterized protein YkwD